MLKTKNTVLEIDNVVKEFPIGKNGKLTACNKVSLCFEKGKTLGIIGESGCGKSTLMKIIMQLEEPTSGQVLYHGEDITKLKGEKLRQHRRNVQMVFQDPSTAFNPKMKVKDIICEPLLNFGLIKKSQKEEVAKEYSDVTLEHQLVDSAAMVMITNPACFDVVVTENLFGDILSDESSVLPGTLGVMPSASHSESGPSLYEPIHGSAPDIAGKGIANPISMILSVAMMLRDSFGETAGAEMIEHAVNKTLTQGILTRDLGGLANTKQMTAAIIANL